MRFVVFFLFPGWQTTELVVFDVFVAYSSIASLSHVFDYSFPRLLFSAWTAHLVFFLLWRRTMLFRGPLSRPAAGLSPYDWFFVFSLSLSACLFLSGILISLVFDLLIPYVPGPTFAFPLYLIFHRSLSSIRPWNDALEFARFLSWRSRFIYYP